MSILNNIMMIVLVFFEITLSAVVLVLAQNWGFHQDVVTVPFDYRFHGGGAVNGCPVINHLVNVHASVQDEFQNLLVQPQESTAS